MVVEIAVVLLALLGLIRWASDRRSQAAGQPGHLKTLPRQSIQGILDRFFFEERLISQTPVTILANERQSEGAGELVLTTRKVHYVAYDDTGYGIAGILSWPLMDVLAMARKTANILVVFVEEPNPQGILDRPDAVTTRFSFRMSNPGAWVERFSAQYRREMPYDWEGASEQELLEQPIVDWTQSMEMFVPLRPY
jgi:hypothetical protein